MNFEFVSVVWPILLTISLGTIGPYVLYRKKKIDEEAKALRFRVTELEVKLAGINQVVVPISAAFQAILIKELTHLHTPEMDALLVKLGPPITLTKTEMERLSMLLIERERDMHEEIPDSEREAALMLPLVMKRVLADENRINKIEIMTVRVDNSTGSNGE